MDNILNGVISIITAIIGVAILSVIVSNKSNTAGVLQAGSQAFSGALGTALSPITSGGMGGYNSF